MFKTFRPMEQNQNSIPNADVPMSASHDHKPMLSECNFGQSKSVITLQAVKNCIGFQINSNLYIALAGMCDYWFAIEKQKGLSDSDSAVVAFDKLAKKITSMS